MTRRQIILVILAVLLLVLIVLLSRKQPPDKSPQQVVMTTGTIKRVANGRAQMWLSSIGIDWRAQLGAVSPTAQVKMMCANDSSTLTVYDDIYTQPVCGVRVRLLEKLKGESSKAAGRFEIVWEEPHG